MRHQYIKQLTNGRATETKSLTFADGRRVIEALIRDQSGAGGAYIQNSATAHAAGTHGRHGHDDGRVAAMASADQIAILFGYADHLGWSRDRLDAFIARQIGAGRAVRTVAHVNKVLWGLKSIYAAHRDGETKISDFAKSSCHHRIGGHSR